MVFKDPFLKKILSEITDQPSRYMLVNIEKRKGEEFLKGVVDVWWGKTNNTFFDYWSGKFELSDEDKGLLRKKYSRAMGDPTLAPKKDPETLKDFHAVTESETIHSRQEGMTDEQIERELDEVFLERIIEESTIINHGQIENNENELPLLEDDTLEIDASSGGEVLLETSSTEKSELILEESSLDSMIIEDETLPELDLEGDNPDEIQTERSDGETLLQTDAVEKSEVRKPKESSLMDRRNYGGETKTISPESGDSKSKENGINEDLLKKIGGVFSDRYEVIKEIARGGMGAVIKIKDKSFRGKEWALKIALPGSDIGRFQNEAYFTAQLDHPGIPDAVETGIIDAKKIGIGGVNGEINYFIQKLVRGKDLEHVLQDIQANGLEGSGYDLNGLLDVFLKVCDTLEYSHINGVIHRDIKPANIMVGSHGEVYLMDWGLAKKIKGGKDSFLSKVMKQYEKGKTALRRFAKDVGTRIFRNKKESEDLEKQLEKTRRKIESKLTNVNISDDYDKTITGDVAGTPGYMSPEQADGQVEKLDGRTDVFAMGALLYKMLTFKIPFEGDTVTNILVSTLEKEPGSLRENWGLDAKSSRILESIVNQALKKELDSEDPDDRRYATITELANDVRRFKANEHVSVHKYGLVEKIKTVNKRYNNLPAVALAVAIAAAGIGGPIIGLLGMQKAASDRKARVAAEGQLEAEKEARLEAEKRVNRAEADVLVSRGLEAEGKNNFEEAFSFYKQATEKDKTYAKAWNNLGYLCFDTLDNFEEAKKYFLIAIESDKIDSNYSLDGLAEKNLADMYFKIGNSKKKKGESYVQLWQEAEEWYQKALGIKDHSETFNRLGILYYNWGKWDGAIRNFSEKVKRTPNSGMGYGLRGLCHFKKFESQVSAGHEGDSQLLRLAIQDFEDAKKRDYEKMNPLLEKAQKILSQRQDKDK